MAGPSRPLRNTTLRSPLSVNIAPLDGSLNFWETEPTVNSTFACSNLRHDDRWRLRGGERSWRTWFSCFGGPFRCSNNCDTNEHAARYSRGTSPIELGCKHLYLKLARFTGSDFTPRCRPSTTTAGASLQPRSHSSLPSRPLTSLSFVRQWHLPAAFRMHSARHQPGEQGKSQCYNLVEALSCLCPMLHFRCCN